jgi:hypothetical protein
MIDSQKKGSSNFHRHRAIFLECMDLHNKSLHREHSPGWDGTYFSSDAGSGHGYYLATSTPFHRAKRPPASRRKRDWNDKPLTPTRESIFVDNLFI